MKPVDRYLQRLRFWLPKQGREDILEELRGALDERLEAAENKKGRPLLDEEAEQVFHSFGPPALVVARYVGGVPVISGDLAFFFWRVLAITLGFILAIQLSVLLVDVVRDPLAIEPILSGLKRLGVALLLGFTCVTGAFMILERRCGRN